MIAPAPPPGLDLASPVVSIADVAGDCQAAGGALAAAVATLAVGRRPSGRRAVAFRDRDAVFPRPPPARHVKIHGCVKTSSSSSRVWWRSIRSIPRSFPGVRAKPR